MCVGNATGNFGSQLNRGFAGRLSVEIRTRRAIWNGRSFWAAPEPRAPIRSRSIHKEVSSSPVRARQPLTTTSIANGNTDSFVASYDGNGNQNWVQQIPTLNNNQANAVTVDSQGNVYIGGSVSGVLGSGQTSSGGTNAYLAELNSSGQIVSENQFGLSGNDSVAATAMTSNGDLLVASQQNGNAILSSYAGGDITSTPAWQINLGSLTGGAISGLAVSGNQILCLRHDQQHRAHGRRAGDDRDAELRATPEAFVFNADRQRHQRDGQQPSAMSVRPRVRPRAAA